jgi:very-short-patch-repair endonuclease
MSSWEFRAARIAAKTRAEEILWTLLRDLKSHIFVLREVPQGPYFLDFYVPHARLAVEIDGSSHNERGHYDRQRDFELRLRGIRTIRFTNNDVLQRPAKVVAAITAAAKQAARRLSA